MAFEIVDIDKIEVRRVSGKYSEFVENLEKINAGDIAQITTATRQTLMAWGDKLKKTHDNKAQIKIFSASKVLYCLKLGTIAPARLKLLQTKGIL
jgi:hypothetical protein